MKKNNLDDKLLFIMIQNAQYCGLVSYKKPNVLHKLMVYIFPLSMGGVLFLTLKSLLESYIKHY